MSARYNYCPLPALFYANLSKEVFCGCYYLRSLNDTVRYPEWPIAEPVALFKSVLEFWKTEMAKEAEEGQASVVEASSVLGLQGDQIVEVRAATPRAR